MTTHDASLGARAMAMIDDLARHTDVPGQLTRLYLSSAHRQAAEHVARLMREAGMTAFIDAAGSVQGRYEGAVPGAPALIIGSHIDSVVDAGRYDGNLGVVLGIVAVAELARRGRRLPFAVEVVAFGDEENVRFPTNLSTSRALAGTYDPVWLAGTDRHGTTLREARIAFGGDPDGIAALARPRGSVIGYLEAHIEQGPVLEAEDRPLGIVSAIAGITRARIALIGEAGHAGTVPMPMRRDALAAAAEMIAAVESLGTRRPDTVATVGVADVRPGAVNVIAGAVDITLDARAPDDGVRREMVAAIRAEIEAIAARRRIGMAWNTFMESPATPMDASLGAALEAGLAAQGLAPRLLLSGAGHDGVAIASLAPVAMLFVRCRGGISHNPAESITTADADAAARALIGALDHLSGAASAG